MRLTKNATVTGYPGFTVRFGFGDLALLTQLTQKLEVKSVNRLVVSAARESLTLAYAEHCRPGADGLLMRCRSLGATSSLCRALALRDVRRGMPQVESASLKLTMPLEGRDALSTSARLLRWAEGHVILEAIHAFFLLAGAKRPLEEIPPIIALIRGLRAANSNRPESTEHLLAELNLGLRLIEPPPLQPPRDALEHETQGEIRLG